MIAVLVIVQITLPPVGTATEVPVNTPPWHTHGPGVKPSGPLSDSVYDPANTDTASTPPGLVGSPLPLTVD